MYNQNPILNTGVNTKVFDNTTIHLQSKHREIPYIQFTHQFN